MSSKKNKVKEFLRSLTNQTTTFFFAFILSTGLIGGGTYLLFGQQSIFSELQELNLELQTRTRELEVWQELQEVAGDQWQSEDGLLFLPEILEVLDDYATLQELPSDFSQSVIDWCPTTIANLRTDIARIDGFVFDSENIQIHQQRTQQLHESSLILTEWICDLFYSKDEFLSTTVDFEVLIDLISSQNEAILALQAFTPTLMNWIELQRLEADFLRQNIKREAQDFSTKYYLALTGVCLGAISIIIITVTWIAINLKKEKRT